MGANYIPEKTAIGPLSADLCEHMVGLGHSVTLITGFPHYPEWRVYDKYRGKMFEREELHGVNVLRGFIYVPPKPTPIHRIAYDSSIAASASVNLLRCGTPDVIVVVSPPLQLAVVALVAGKLWRVPVLLSIQDIVPDVAIQLGILKSRTLVSLARWLEHLCYRHATHIAVICDGFIDNLVGKSVPLNKLSVIHNWVDTDVIRPLNRLNGFRDKHGIGPEIFLVLYAGNMGAKQGLDAIIYTAKQLQDQPNMRFILVGDGVAMQGLSQMAQQRKLPNLSFLPFETEEMLPEMLAAADVLFISQSRFVSSEVLPAKLSKYMAAGRPVVAAVSSESETASHIRKSRGGIVVRPDRPSEIARTLRNLLQNNCLGEELGANGRRYVEGNMAREGMLKRYAGLIESLARTGSRVGAR